MRTRACRDCAVPNCGARYHVKLSNHLTTVHGHDYSEPRKLLQEAKLHPKIQFIVYEDNQRESLGLLDSTRNQEERVKKVIFEARNSRKVPYKKAKRKECLIKKLKTIRKRMCNSELQEKLLKR